MEKSTSKKSRRLGAMAASALELGSHIASGQEAPHTEHVQQSEQTAPERELTTTATFTIDKHHYNVSFTEAKSEAGLHILDAGDPTKPEDDYRIRVRIDKEDKGKGSFETSSMIFAPEGKRAFMDNPFGRDPYTPSMLTADDPDMEMSKVNRIKTEMALYYTILKAYYALGIGEGTHAAEIREDIMEQIDQIHAIHPDVVIQPARLAEVGITPAVQAARRKKIQEEESKKQYR